MSQALTKKRIASFAVLVPMLVSLFLTTGINIDPVNLPKMVLLASCAGYLLGLLASTKFQGLRENRVLTGISLFLLLSLLTSLFLSKSPLVQSFYGSYARNTGFLTYFSLLILFIAISGIKIEKYFHWLLISLFSAGLFNVIYGFLQINGIDPVDWNNIFNAIIGTFGNPNFSSAFISISLITYPLIYNHFQSKIFRILLVVAFLMSIFAIFRTKSQQGYFLFLIGLAIVIIVYFLKTYKLRYLGFVSLAITSLGTITGILGFLQKGPLSEFLYQPSISLRGFYWGAGLSMFGESPLFGNGFDSYGELYLRNRSANSVLPPGGENVFSNAAHNVYIDVAASGGLLFLIPYLAIAIYAVILAFRVFKNKEFNLRFTSLFGVWVALQIQSLISINQIGLGVWIWGVNGAVIGYAILLLNPPNLNTETKSKKQKKQETSASAFLFGTIFVIAFSGAALPEQIADMSFKSNMDNRNVEKIIKVVESSPLSSERMSRASQVFLRNALYDQALEISLTAVDFNPNHLNSWITLLSNPKASKAQRELAKENLIRIDPRSSQWKKIEIK
jgi:O-antigen ligase